MTVKRERERGGVSVCVLVFATYFCINLTKSELFMRSGYRFNSFNIILAIIYMVSSAFLRDKIIFLDFICILTPVTGCGEYIVSRRLLLHCGF